jgi:hypothetical protein
MHRHEQPCPKTSPPPKIFLGLAGKCDICYNYGHKKPPIVGAVVIFANLVNLEGDTMANGTSSLDFTGMSLLLKVANSYEERINNIDLKNTHLEKRTFAEKPRTNIESEIQHLEASEDPLNFIKNRTEENSLVGKILAHCFKHACAPFLKDPENPITSDNIKMPAGGTHELLQKFTDARAFAASQALRILADIPAIKNMNQDTRTCFLREFDAKCQTGLIEVLSLLIDISHDRRAEDRKQNAAIISPTKAFFAGELMRMQQENFKKHEDREQDPTSTTLADLSTDAFLLAELKRRQQALGQ